MRLWLRGAAAQPFSYEKLKIIKLSIHIFFPSLFSNTIFNELLVFSKITMHLLLNNRLFTFKNARMITVTNTYLINTEHWVSWNRITWHLCWAWDKPIKISIKNSNHSTYTSLFFYWVILHHVSRYCWLCYCDTQQQSDYPTNRNTRNTRK